MTATNPSRKSFEEIIDLLVALPIEDAIQVLFTIIGVWSWMLVPPEPHDLKTGWLQQMYEPLDVRLTAGDVTIAPDLVQYLTEVDPFDRLKTSQATPDAYRFALSMLLYNYLYTDVAQVHGSRQAIVAKSLPPDVYKTQIGQVVTYLLQGSVQQLVERLAQVIIGWATTSPPIPPQSISKTYESTLLVWRFLEWLER